MKSIQTPTSALIEKTAIEIAACFYEQGRSLGFKSKHKNARAYAKANLEKFVPKATEILVEMLGRPDISEIMKQEIYAAVIERANDPELLILDQPKNSQVSVLENIRKFDPKDLGFDIKDLN